MNPSQITETTLKIFVLSVSTLSILPDDTRSSSSEQHQQHRQNCCLSLLSFRKPEEKENQLKNR